MSHSSCFLLSFSSLLKFLFFSPQQALNDTESLRLLCESCEDLGDFPVFLFNFFLSHGTDKVYFLMRWAIEREVKAHKSMCTVFLFITLSFFWLSLSLLEFLIYHSFAPVMSTCCSCCYCCHWWLLAPQVSAIPSDLFVNFRFDFADDPNSLCRGDTLVTRLFLHKFFGELGRKFLSHVLVCQSAIVAVGSGNSTRGEERSGEEGQSRGRRKRGDLFHCLFLQTPLVEEILEKEKERSLEVAVSLLLSTLFPLPPLSSLLPLYCLRCLARSLLPNSETPIFSFLALSPLPPPLHFSSTRSNLPNWRP